MAALWSKGKQLDRVIVVAVFIISGQASNGNRWLRIRIARMGFYPEGDRPQLKMIKNFDNTYAG